MPIPMILLTGYLGAGKTTLLNHLLQLPGIMNLDVALLINEFGQLGIDGQLVDAKDRVVFELNKGSLFCICIKTDFLKTLRKISEGHQPELLIVEATGMAEPRDIQDFIDEPTLAAAFEIKSNLCLIDAVTFIKILPMMRAARMQAQWADGLVINKIDKISAFERLQLEAVLAELNPQAPQVAVEFGRIPEHFLSSLHHRIQRAPPLNSPPDPVFSESFVATKRLDRDRLANTIDKLGDRLLRLKGYGDFGEGSVFMEVANGTFSVQPASTDKSGKCSFVVIAWHIRQEELRKLFEACFHDDAP